ncbi:hypothetical protein T484DRAFT_1906633, partial [Baffinella frigidus]
MRHVARVHAALHAAKARGMAAWGAVLSEVARRAQAEKRMALRRDTRSVFRTVCCWDGLTRTRGRIARHEAESSRKRRVQSVVLAVRLWASLTSMRRRVARWVERVRWKVRARVVAVWSAHASDCREERRAAAVGAREEAPPMLDPPTRVVSVAGAGMVGRAGRVESVASRTSRSSAAARGEVVVEGAVEGAVEGEDGGNPPHQSSESRPRDGRDSTIPAPATLTTRFEGSDVGVLLSPGGSDGGAPSPVGVLSLAPLVGAQLVGERRTARGSRTPPPTPTTPPPAASDAASSGRRLAREEVAREREGVLVGVVDERKRALGEAERGEEGLEADAGGRARVLLPDAEERGRILVAEGEEERVGMVADAEQREVALVADAEQFRAGLAEGLRYPPRSVPTERVERRQGAGLGGERLPLQERFRESGERERGMVEDAGRIHELLPGTAALQERVRESEERERGMMEDAGRMCAENAALVAQVARLTELEDVARQTLMACTKALQARRQTPSD